MQRNDESILFLLWFEGSNLGRERKERVCYDGVGVV